MLEFDDLATANEWLYKAATALTAFWFPDDSCFLRATGPPLTGAASRSDGFDERTGATSSNRAFLTLTELLFHLVEEERWADPLERDGRRFANDRWLQLGDVLFEQWSTMATNYYTIPLRTLQRHSDNGVNNFTDAHLMVALSVLGAPFSVQQLGHRPSFEAPSLLEQFADKFENTIEEHRGARIAGTGPTHPLLTLNAVRAVEIARHVTGAPGGRSRVGDSLETIVRGNARDDLFRQLGMHAADDAEFDPAALLGDIALLHRYAGLSARQLVEKGLELLSDAQRDDGAWKTRILTGDKKLVYMPSIELSVSLANLVLSDLTEGSDRLARLAQPILAKALAFLESGYHESQEGKGRITSGWINDQSRQPHVVESWSTSLAIQLLLRVRRIARRLEQHTILKRYRTTDPEISRREWLRWPDLAGPIPLVRSAEVESARARDELQHLSDPTPNDAVRYAIQHDIVDPILADAFNRPGRTRSLTLYGPPGTRKSSMVGSLAAALDWPLVTLAPPDFLAEGMVGLEANAERIFRHLLELRHVVVFFDECEELFRRRTVLNSPEHRTQSDFITSGMLARLQDLYSKRWLIFAIATNTELDEIDPAIVRFGRMGARERIGHPTVDAQMRYVRRMQKLPAGFDAQIVDAVRQYDDFLESHIAPNTRASLDDARNEAKDAFLKSGNLRKYFRRVDKIRLLESELPLVTFAVLDEYVKRLAAIDTHSATATYELLAQLAGTKGRPEEWSVIYGDYVPDD